jgi:hypothetical protein
MNPDQAREAAAEFRRINKFIDEVMGQLDTTSTPCSCCGVVKYNNWQQNNLWLKLEGLAERIEGVGSALAKGANNNEFLGIEKVTVR